MDYRKQLYEEGKVVGKRLKEMRKDLEELSERLDNIQVESEEVGD